MRARELFGERRFQIPLGAIAVALLLIVIVAAQGSDHDQRISLEGPTATASSEPTTTTEAVTTTEATTTSTTVATTTTSSTAPPVVITAPPATAPPATAPPSSGSLDLSAVVAFAKANRPNLPPPYMYSGSSCEVASERLYDEGDDPNGDLGMVQLIRDCGGTFRLFPGANDGLFGAYWVEVDGGPGGCGGVDAVAVTWPTPKSSSGAVVNTPACDQGSWAAVDTTANPAFPGKLLDFRGSTFGDPAGFRWRAGMLGEGDPTIDHAPNSGFAAFQR